MPYKPAILLLGTHPKEMKSIYKKDICTEKPCLEKAKTAKRKGEKRKEKKVPETPGLSQHCSPRPGCRIKVFEQMNG